MRWLLAGVLLAAASVSGAEQENLAVLPKDGPDGPPGRMLYRYLVRQSRPLFEARRKAFAAALTAEALAARQKRLRECFIDALGGFPQRTALQPRALGAIKEQGYRIEKVVYESRRQHHVTANVYVPSGGEPPYPGVLVPCGHSKNGKACGPYQSVCILLARHGFVALCYDPIGQGERFQLLDEAGKPIVGGTTEHTLEGVGALLVGWNTASYRIWDGIRSIDYLAARPDVDAKRIGCTGNSGGGTLTSYLMALDERIVAAAPSCYLVGLERLFDTIGPQDAEQNITGQVAFGMEHADYITLRAPKPTLMCTATRDYFDIGGAWATYREAKRLYGALGCNDRVEIIETDAKHGFSTPLRQAAVRWMRRWLMQDDRPVVEGELKLQADADLQVTQTGQVVSQWHGVTVWDLNLRQATHLAAARKDFWRNNAKPRCLDEVRRLIGLRPARDKAAAEKLATVRRERCRIEKLILRRPDEVPVPALLFVPETDKRSHAACVIVDGRGKHVEAAPGGRAAALAAQGNIVLTIDVRGFGETAAGKPHRYWGTDFKTAFVALHIARPLLGQRVEDTLAALEVLLARSDVDPRRVEVIGIGRGGPVALHAAALDERFAGASIERSIESWLDVVATPLARDQLGSVVPGALGCYDLPDLVAAIAPRPVRIVDPVDPTGQPKN